MQTGSPHFPVRVIRAEGIPLEAGKHNSRTAKIEPAGETIIKHGADKANLLVSLVKGIPLAGCDQSFKVTENALLGHRFLFGIRKSQVQADRVSDICERLGMPHEYAVALRKKFADANAIHFGFEENENGCVYKVYLEFRERLNEKIRNRPGPDDGVLLHLAFKWDAGDNAKRAITNYICYPALDTPGILKRMSGVYEGHQDTTSFEVAKGIVNLAAHRFVNSAPMYLEAHEDNNPRLSFDIKLYRANLQLKDIHNFLSGLCRHYYIPSGPFESFYSRINDRVLGHLSAGSDRHGRDFLTIYHERWRDVAEEGRQI
jgi:hypothetical protein